MGLEQEQVYAECDVCGTLRDSLGWGVTRARAILKREGWYVHKVPFRETTETTCPDCWKVK